MSFELTFGLLAARHVITLFSFDRPLVGQITAPANAPTIL